ncbi:MAG: protein kinase [Kofleriaceae bacterium]
MGPERLGRYTILRHLASGGMADVLLARTEGIEGFERHVVVKRIKPELAKDKRFIHMFLDEARLAATLHHQNVVQVHDIGEEHGEYFFAMEYVHGEDVRKILGATSKAKQHLKLGDVIGIVCGAAAGLHYAHERRDSNKKKLEIVHRDVSPSNIIVGYDGSVKLLDFGIAKAVARTTSETRTGTLKGKASYMSPEQCKGVQAIDRRSDVYSLGVVLYELATTARLFKAESDYLVMDAIVNGKVPLPRVKRPDLPNELSSIIMRALAVDPDRRYQSADELRLALEDFAERAGLAANLGSQMKKLFGERPEPWLELDKPNRKVERSSWTDVADEDAETSLSDPPTTDQRRIGRASGSHQSMPPASASVSGSSSGSHKAIPRASTASGSHKSIPVRETRTSQRMAWELSTPRPQTVNTGEIRKRTKAALLLGPIIVAVGGFAGWEYWQSRQKETATATATTPNQEGAKDSLTLAPTPTPTSPTVTPIAPSTIDTPTPPPPVVSPPVRTGMNTPRQTQTQKAAAPQALTAPATSPTTPAPPPTPVPPPTITSSGTGSGTPTSTSTSTGTSTPVTPEPPPPAQDPKTAMTMLSAATVTMVAGDHAAQLSKCEAIATIHGDVAISFEINAAGKVISSQISSTIHNPKVAACILTALRSWAFPKPPSGSAKGVYTINYQ